MMCPDIKPLPYPYWECHDFEDGKIVLAGEGLEDGECGVQDDEEPRDPCQK